MQSPSPSLRSSALGTAAVLALLACFARCSPDSQEVIPVGTLDQVGAAEAGDTQAVDAQAVDVQAVETLVAEVAQVQPCTSDKECPGDLPACDLQATPPTCVPCIRAKHCGGVTPTCIAAKCQPALTCVTDKDCASVGGVCGVAGGSAASKCVDCNDKQDCGGGRECVASQCLPPPPACTSSKQCAPFDAVCDSAVGHCVECLVAADCPQGLTCVKATCLPTVCMPGAMKCEGQSASLVCRPDGTGFDKTPCGAGAVCAQGSCKEIICEAGKKGCAGNAVAVCSGGVAWVDPVDCPGGQICNAGACVSKPCSVGDKACDGTGKVKTCKSDETGWDVQPCPAQTACEQGACKSLICSPGQKSCVGSKAVQCDGKGLQASVLQDCATLSKGCMDGACVDKVCEQGQTSCIGDKLGTCAADGKGWVESPCPDLDGNKCTPEACDPTAKKCVQGAPNSCDDGTTCTVDDCNAWTGICSHVAVPGSCDDGSACTTGDACIAGKCISGPGAVSTLAGSGTGGFADGQGGQAMFNLPKDMAVMADGSAVVADFHNHRLRLVTAAGAVSTLAGTGQAAYEDGPAGQARFKNPWGVAAGKGGVLYVADSGNHRLRRINAVGVVSTWAGDGSEGYQDGAAAQAKLSGPRGLALDGFGNLYVADGLNHRIRKVSQEGVVTTVAGSGQLGFKDGPATSASFNYPTGICIDKSGNLYVADMNNHRLRRISPGGTVSTLAGSGEAGHQDGAGSSAKFNKPSAVLFAPTGQLLVAEAGNHRIRAVGLDASVSTLAGSGTQGWADGPAAQALFSVPVALALDAGGNLLIADSGTHRIRRMAATTKNCDDGSPCTADSCDPKTGQCKHAASAPGVACDDGSACTTGEACDKSGGCMGKVQSCDDGNVCTTDACNPYNGKCEFGANENKCDDGNLCTLAEQCVAGKCVSDIVVVQTVAGSGTAGYLDGPAASAAFNAPSDVVLDGKGGAWISERNNNRIRRLLPGGVVSTAAGAGTKGYLDGLATSAQFSGPEDLALDAKGDVLIADTGNHRIRHLSAAGVVSTLAGSGAPGWQDGAASSAKFNAPSGIALDTNGQLVIADTANNRLRLLSATGQVSTLAGTGSAGFNDGPASQAQLSGPSGLAIDANGVIYFTDSNNHRVRKLAAGTVSTVAGGGAGFADGPAAQAAFHSPRGLALDPAGGIVVADRLNHRIRHIDAMGVVSTLAGSGAKGFADGMAAASAWNEPGDIGLDAAGHAWVVDGLNHRLRKVNNPLVVCEPGQPCKPTACDPKTGKCATKVTSEGGGCVGAHCMEGQTCKSGSCQGGKAKVCDDGDKCTADACDAQTGKCVATPLLGPGCCVPTSFERNFDAANQAAGFTFSTCTASKSNFAPTGCKPTTAVTKGWQVWTTGQYAKSGTGTLYYGNPQTKNFNWGPNAGTARTPVVQVPSGKSAVSFWIRWDCENGTTYDRLAVYLFIDGVKQVIGAPGNPNAGALWLKGGTGNTTPKTWQHVSHDVSPWTGKGLQLEFYFNTGDNTANTGYGISVDDLKVTTDCGG